VTILLVHYGVGDAYYFQSATAIRSASISTIRRAPTCHREPGRLTEPASAGSAYRDGDRRRSSGSSAKRSLKGTQVDRVL